MSTVNTNEHPASHQLTHEASASQWQLEAASLPAMQSVCKPKGLLQDSQYDHINLRTSGSKTIFACEDHDLLQSDWCHQHFGVVHKILAIVTVVFCQLVYVNAVWQTLVQVYNKCLLPAMMCTVHSGWWSWKSFFFNFCNKILQLGITEQMFGL